MANTSVSCPSCGSPLSVPESSGTQIVSCPGCKKELEIDFPAAAGRSDGNVGAGVPSFRRSKVGDDTPGALSRKEREALETGGLGDLIFNPMEGLGRAFTGLGAGSSLLIALLIFVVSVGSIWYLVFQSIASDLDSDVSEILQLVDWSNHLSLVFILLLIPLTLYLLLQLFALFAQTTASPWQIFAATAVIFIPWAAILGFIAITILFPPARDAIGVPLGLVLEFFKSGFSSVPGAMNFASWLTLIAIISLVITLIVHPLLLIFSALTNVVGMSQQAAFFVTPFIPTLHFVLLISVANLIGALDFLQLQDIKDLAF